MPEVNNITIITGFNLILFKMYKQLIHQRINDNKTISKENPESR